MVFLVFDGFPVLGPVDREGHNIIDPDKPQYLMDLGFKMFQVMAIGPLVAHATDQIGPFAHHKVFAALLRVQEKVIWERTIGSI